MIRTLMLFLSLTLVSPALLVQVDARMLQYPGVSQTHIVFSYAGDLWVVPKEGGTALRLSSPSGQELYPYFSPDGSQISCSADMGATRRIGATSPASTS